MDHAFCPGARLLRQPKLEVTKCSSCGSEVEIWSDEMRVTCPVCKSAVVRDGNTSCLDWCKMGKDCVGADVYDKYMAQKSVNVKQMLLAELEKYFGADAKRIAHAKAVLCFAEGLLKRGTADWHIVVPAALLHDVGIKVAEAKYGSAAGKYQEIEGPPIVRKILLKAGLPHENIEEICGIVAHHHSPGENETENFRTLFDADNLVNIEEIIKGQAAEQCRQLIEKTFLTAAGKEMATELYVK
ncbi:MAG: HD domain-containing protein [Chitinivibrionales bacterium]|nr:HD domain-containing protein [Chitinivibrionales bacterium]